MPTTLSTGYVPAGIPLILILVIVQVAVDIHFPLHISGPLQQEPVNVSKGQ